MIAARSLILGLHGTPAWSLDRGIARYTTEVIRALVDVAPDAIAQVDLEPGQPLPSRLEGIVGRVPLAASGTAPASAASPSVYSIIAPFDPVQVERIWPPWAREPQVGLAVTLHDLIPLEFRESYLTETGYRTSYAVRLGMIRVADVVMANSKQTADDALRHLDLDPERLVVIGGGCSEAFQEPDRPVSQIVEDLRRHLPSIRPGYVLYHGAADARKNVVRLVEAYAELPPEVRSQHQLVLSGRHDPPDRQNLVRVARDRGLNAELVFTDRISDTLLVQLYQGCIGFVFPSLYEGFGLPVLEAMSCGAPVIASDIPVLAELVTEPAARFDPLATAGITAGMMKLIRDPGLRSELKRLGKAQVRRCSWPQVARRSLEAYEIAIERRRRIGAAHVPPRSG